MLVLSRGDVEALLDLDRLVDAVAAAMADLSHGRASMPPRVAVARALSRLPGTEVVQIAGRDHDKVAALTRELAESGIRAQPAASIENAVRSAGIVCAATHAGEPVVRREWLRPGTHINSVDFNSAGAGEVDIDTIRDALVVVESRTAVLAAPPAAAGAVELRRAIEAGVIGADHIHAEIGELVTGDRPGRTDPAQITVYKSVGVAVQDAAAAALVLQSARDHGVGSHAEM